MENLKNYYNNVINEICIKVVDAFNSSYNLNLNKDNIMNNLIHESKDVQPLVNEMQKLSINNMCIGVKRNKKNCTNKALPGHMYCGTHIKSEGKDPLDQHVKLIVEKFKYEVTPNTVSLGNQWIIRYNDQSDKNHGKYPLEIETIPGNINSYILFFTEFKEYFGAGVFILQYTSSDKKQNYYMATHYVEVNKYGENMESNLLTKISFKSIASLEDKSIFYNIKSFLSEFGISYNINDINKRNNDISEYNPVVMYNKINKIIESNYNTLYFYHDAYINSNLDKN